jgi:hypothetical protein
MALACRVEEPTTASKTDIVSEPELLQAMFDVGYFPPNTPPDKYPVAVRKHRLRGQPPD